MGTDARGPHALLLNNYAEQSAFTIFFLPMEVTRLSFLVLQRGPVMAGGHVTAKTSEFQNSGGHVTSDMLKFGI